VRPDERDAAVELLAPAPLDRREQRAHEHRAVGHQLRVGTERGDVLQGRGAGAPADGVVRRLHERGHRGDQVEPRGEDLRAERGQVRIPHLEGREHVVGAAPAAARRGGGLQQSVALLEDPVVVRAHAGHPRGPRDEQVVEEPAALGGVALHQREVLGREQHRAQKAEHLARARHRRPVDPRAVGTAGVDLDLDDRLAVLACDAGAHDRALGSDPHQRRVGGHAVAAEGGDVPHGLDEVGLALAVLADERGDAGPQLEIDLGVAAEVGQRQGGDVHALS